MMIYPREAVRCLVRSLGYNALTFSSAEEFLESVETTACLISDVQMPGLSGVELQARLIADGRSTPIIFATAYPNEIFGTMPSEPVRSAF
jgi:FixJ family two-component response regulator